MEDDLLDAFASQGEIRQNQTYVGQRLMFTRNGDVESSFMSFVTGGDVLRHIGMVLLLQVLWTFLGGFVFLVIYFLLLIGSGGDAIAASGSLLILGLIYMLIGLALFILPFFSWTQTPMSEWQLYLDERSTSIQSAYRSIADSLRRRSVPARVEPVTMDVGAGGPGQHLLVSQNPYSAYITVMPYGTGLFLSWSLWREQRAYMLYVEWVRHLRYARAGTDGLLHELLRAHPARAMREAVHNAVRDGVEAAVVGGASKGLQG